MTLTAPKSLLLILALLFGGWWMTRDHGPPTDPDAPPSAEAGLDRVMVGKLELAVTSTANAAECGYTEVGYGYREPAEAPGHLVALMRSASGPPPPPSTGEPMVEYVVDGPQQPWQVAVHLDPEGPTLVIDGYGPDLAEPMFSRRVPCS